MVLMGQCVYFTHAFSTLTLGVTSLNLVSLLISKLNDSVAISQ